MPDAAELAKYTERVNANNRLAYSLAGLEKPRPDVKPVPVPQRHGEPSVFKHVIYIIKENRTYDQVFGDMKEGNGDPKLCMFGEEVTPNHHALARQFTLFDNFYCSGVLSADGHPWVNEAYVTDYLEKAFGGFTRSYPDDGSDPLAFAPTGFLWDNALAHKKTFRNYGEFVTETTYTPKGTTWTDVYDDFKNGTRKVTINADGQRQAAGAVHAPDLSRVSRCTMPDVYRAELFLDELKEFEKKGDVAEPDLRVPAVRPHRAAPGPACRRRGRWSPTTTWPWAGSSRRSARASSGRTTCIFVVEDDPQNGFDHVDGHRTVALVDQPVHAAQVRRSHQLQPDRHGQDDRADPRPAADEPARPVGDADAELLPGRSRT